MTFPPADKLKTTNAYAFDTMGDEATAIAPWLFVGAGVLAVLGLGGLWHAFTRAGAEDLAAGRAGSRAPVGETGRGSLSVTRSTSTVSPRTPVPDHARSDQVMRRLAAW